jgi:glutamate dehydrogenase
LKDNAPKNVPHMSFFENSFTPNQTFVSILNLDYPFLVSTIKIILKDLKLTPSLLMHPVLSIKRDEAGHILDIKRAKDDAQIVRDSFVDESVIHFMLPVSLTALKSTGFQERLLEAVSDIVLFSDDHRVIMDKMHDLARVDEIFSFSLNFKGSEKQQFFETANFLAWLNESYFTAAGYRYFEADATGKLTTSVYTSSLGLFKDVDKAESPLFLPPLDAHPSKSHYLTMIKLNVRSKFNRGSLFDSLQIIDLDENGNVKGFHQFLGLFTARFFESAPRSVPIAERIVQKIFDKFGFKHDWYNGRLLNSILESLPLDLFFNESLDNIYHLCENILRQQSNVCLYLRHLKTAENVLMLVYVPIEKYSFEIKEKFKEYIAQKFESKIRSEHVYLRESTFVRIVFSLDYHKSTDTIPSVKQIAHDLDELALTWDDRLKKIASENYDAITQIFPIKFKIDFYPQDAVQIFEHHMATENNDISFQLIEDKKFLRLHVIKNDHPIVLSEILTIIEKFGLQLTAESTYQLQTADKKYLHVFFLKNDLETNHIAKTFPLLIDALESVWRKKANNDVLNALIIGADMSIREVAVLQSYCRMLIQLGIRYSADYMKQCLLHHPKFARYLIDAFHQKFNPATHDLVALNLSMAKLSKYIKTLEKLDDDRILTNFMDLVSHTLRTNFFQHDDGKSKDYISFKFSSRQIREMPEPKPLYEIFVYAQKVEGCHLRGGEVSRGGLRWSDRSEDYRSEVLALMKAQMVKNAVIVPLGSKGGFIVKNYEALKESGASQTVLKEAVVDAYKTYIQALLDITDNRINGQDIRPKDCICYDDFDSYLVVAADKGTATFSDIANGISLQNNFWLGDAFASGGSNGYDHKKMGITAKGAWISIKHHFKEIGVDIQKDDFSVVGVGDMAGDVFGNGMLVTPHSRLIAAFNHEHIFIDPTPDNHVSFKERKRLFQLNGSKWTDYKLDCLSAGGGIYSRRDKTIKLSHEAKKALDISDKILELTPDELIQLILKAPVDLLWFGGIGTFVKSAYETDDQVKDHVNNNLRINANDVRAKVVGEGANLGCTQKARIEYGLLGGKINTDAIDNSAGVDCSDHEVNIKILCQYLERHHLITRDERNQLLSEMTNDVAELVLKDNKEQNFILSVMECKSSLNILNYNAYIKKMATSESLPLNRTIEYLPTEDEFSLRYAQKIGLMRPELAIILAYTKINLYTDILKKMSDIQIDLTPMLMGYFPKLLQEKFDNAVIKHELASEIKATVLSNYLVNRLGALFFYEVGLSTTKSTAEVVNALMSVIHHFKLDNLWCMIDESKLSLDKKYDLTSQLSSLIRQMVLIVLRSKTTIIVDMNPDIIAGFVDKYMSRIKGLKNTHHDEIIDVVSFYPMILEALCDKHYNNMNVESMVEIYLKLQSQIDMGIFLKIKKKVTPLTDWERMLKNMLNDDLSLVQWQLVKQQMRGEDININADFKEKFDNFIFDITSSPAINLSHYAYGIKVLNQLSTPE